MALLELRDVFFTAGDREVLLGLSFSVSPGEVHALIGTNGTGKSTLAYLIMGCDGYRPTAGEVLFEGTTISDLRLHERARLGITMAWQEPVRFEGISVKDYLTLKDRGSDPGPYLDLVGLHPERYLNRMVDKSLSGGERKRIELASILALGPRLALLDEPDSGIDMLSINDIVNVIRAFKERGASVLLITHREDIALIADKASQLCRGRIVCTGNPEKVAEFYKARGCLVCDGKECQYV